MPKFLISNKKKLFILFVKISKEIRSFEKYLFFKKWQGFEKFFFFRKKKREKWLVIRTIFNTSKKILRNSVDKLVLQIPLKFKIDRLKIVASSTASRIEKCAFEKNVFRILNSVYQLSEAFDVEGTLKIKYFYL